MKNTKTIGITSPTEGERYDYGKAKRKKKIIRKESGIQ